jgi:hypothetical protein
MWRGFEPVLGTIGALVSRAKRAVMGDVQSKSGPLGLKTCTFIDIDFLHVMLEVAQTPTFPTFEGMEDEG